MDIFEKGKMINLRDVLVNKEWRVQKIVELTESFSLSTIVSVKLNIPGAVKNNDKIRQIFEVGWLSLENDSQSKELFLNKLTGPEGFLVFPQPARDIKIKMIDFEENHALGRLFDSDVSGLSRQLLGFPERKCFVCQRPAKECARAERHTKEEIMMAIDKLVGDFFDDR